jgi:ribonucleoside-diphosphate reductase subunit M1
VRNKLIAANGSVQGITEIPEEGREIFKTVWEISQKEILNLALGRSPFIDQSQSLNIHLAEPSYSKMCSVHFYAWKQGLKTGMYYLRSRPAADPIKFTVDVETLLKNAGEILPQEQQEEDEVMKERRDNYLEDEEKDAVKKRFKPAPAEQEVPVKACPMRRKGAPQDEDCLACGS